MGREVAMLSADVDRYISLRGDKQGETRLILIVAL
ncbi:hypothetical protein JOH51_007399 [Rhizobium leguminosarum]|nr:hypothetical protein [Rhizobium leguminosarum]